MWLTKSYEEKIQQEYKIKNKITEVTGEKHTLELFDSEFFGNIAFIDGYVMLQSTLSIQSELLAHIAACSHKNPKRALIVGGFNIEIAHELTKHEGLSVDFLQQDLDVLETLISFFPHYQSIFKNNRFSHISQDKEMFIKKSIEDSSLYDIVISLNSDVASYKEVLSDDGILISHMPHLMLEFDKAEEFLRGFSDFRILMPFIAPLSLSLKDCYMFASKKYHPTADIMLQRADMLDDLEYYCANLHLSAFVIPKSIKNKLYGIVKN